MYAAINISGHIIYLMADNTCSDNECSIYYSVGFSCISWLFNIRIELCIIFSSTMAVADVSVRLPKRNHNGIYAHFQE